MTRTVPAAALPDEPFPLGAHPDERGAHFALASRADRVELCLFGDDGTEIRVTLPEYDAGIWHGYVPGVTSGQAYGYRAHGPWDPARGCATTPPNSCSTPT